MKIASWNVNSIKSRVGHVEKWLKEHQPDFLFLQELKGVAENFPSDVFTSLGYKLHLKGQKAYNGVAILSKETCHLISTTLPCFEEDEQARYIEVEKDNCRYICIYAPNGNPIGTEKFSYKLKWLRYLKSYIQQLLAEETPFMIGGDYNIIPETIDCENPADWEDDALFQSESRALYREMLNLGCVDAYRALYPNQHRSYSFWGYQAGAWQRDAGIRIDHFLLSPNIAERLKDVYIYRDERGVDSPSDHVPILIDISY